MADVQMSSVTKNFGDNEVIHSVDLKVDDDEIIINNVSDGNE